MCVRVHVHVRVRVRVRVSACVCAYIHTGSQDAQTHVASVWEQVVSNRKALRNGDPRQYVLIAAHSTGGPAVLALMRARPLEFVTHVHAVALLDSVHKNPKLVTNSSDGGGGDSTESLLSRTRVQFRDVLHASRT